MAKPKRILICKIAALGDVVFALPAVDSIKAALPDAEITWVVGKSCAPLLSGNPRIARVIAIDDKALFSPGIGRRLNVVRQIRSQLDRYDLILIAHRGLAFSLALFGHGPIVQLARSARKLAGLFAKQIIVEPMSLHESLAVKELTLEGLRTLGAKDSEHPWEWDLSYLSLLPLSIELPPDFICIHVGGGQNAGAEFTLKRWPHWSALIDLLAAAGRSVVLVGAPSEMDVAEGVMNGSGEAALGRIWNCVGKTSITQLVKLITSADAFIGPDSGPLHIADALGLPTVGLYGATSIRSWGLLKPTSSSVSVNVPCSPCYKDDGYYPPCPFEVRCMNQLSPEMVVASLHETLACKPAC